MNPPESFARREMLRRSLRYGGVATLAGLAAWLGRRGDCVDGSPCHACPVFDGCARPRAESARRASETPPHRNDPGHG